ncbi:MAG: hypothetical protein M1830_005387 [Pleopsidium flavum]|nr:MAG: hypothetical protein M1830_005387 [Pleopsidium flavum]
MIQLRPATSRSLHAFARRQLIPHRTALPYRLYATVETHPAAPSPSSQTPPTFPTTSNGTTTDSTPPPPPPPPTRSLRPLIYATAFLLLGLTTGHLTLLTLLPPPHLILPSTLDELAALHTALDHLPITQDLRAHPQIWHEHPAYFSLPRTTLPHRLTTGPLSGPTGLAIQQIFHHATEPRAINIIYCGRGLCGWPGITHGGVSATVMDESLGRVAIREFKAKTGVTANLELDYRRPVVAGRFYVVRAEAVREGRGERKMWVKGTLEDLEGRVCVEGKGLFVVPKGVELGEVEEGF